MNLFYFSAITAVILASHSVLGAIDGNVNAKKPGWMSRKKTTMPPTTVLAETTLPPTMPPTTVVVETPSPSPAELLTTLIAKIVYPKKTPAPELPTPTVANLETTVGEAITEAPKAETTVGEAITEAPKAETTSLAPPPPPTEAPVVETTVAPEPETEAPKVETTMAPEAETPSMAPPVVPEGAKTPKAPGKGTPAPTLPPVDFDCREKADGYYADPKDKCSSKYYACVGGLARELMCAASDLVYEPDTMACERRQDSFRCTGVRKTTLPSTPRRPVPTPEKLPIDCSKLDDAWYPDPQQKCSHIFYSCSNGLGSRFTCPGNMYFDVETTRCQAWLDVMACAGKRPPTTKKPVITTNPPVTEKLPIDCMEKPSGQYPDPEKKCSQIYYVCSNGDAFKRSCPDGLYFDAKNQLCDYFDEIFDCTGKTKPPTKPTPAPKPSPASLLSSEYDCKGKADASYLPADKKCSDVYYRCVGGATYKLKCPDGLYYDIDNDLCDRWANLFVCSGKKPTSPAPTTTTQPRPTEKLPIDCGLYEDGDFPDPEKKCSNVYYSCSNHGGSRRLCPEGLFFDQELSLCDLHSNVPDCTGKPRPAPTTPRPTKRPAAPPKYPYNCEKKGDGNYEAAKCTDYYWSCVGGTTIRASCPSGTAYDSEFDQCGYKHEIPACGGVRPSTEKP